MNFLSKYVFWFFFLLMLGVIFIVSELIFMFYNYFILIDYEFISINSCSDDYNSSRFIFLVVLFVCSMMFMIISPNLTSILLSWDGLGSVSYCLIIYFQNYSSYSAGMLTILTNHLGDVTLLGISLYFNKLQLVFIF